MECGDSGTKWYHRPRGVREMLSYWCCFWRASGSELHCWKLRVLPSSLFISSRWAFFSASMAAEGDSEKRGIRLCQPHGKHTGELAKLSSLQGPRSISADSSSSLLPSGYSSPSPHSRIITLPRGLTLWELSTTSALPIYNKVLVSSHPSRGMTPFPSGSLPPHLHQCHRSEKHQSSCFQGAPA